MPAEALPFDLAVAQELHDQLLKPFDDLIKGKSLIIVPSGPLTSLPFHVLVIEPLSQGGIAAAPELRQRAGLPQGRLAGT